MVIVYLYTTVRYSIKGGKMFNRYELLELLINWVGFTVIVTIIVLSSMGY